MFGLRRVVLGLVLCGLLGACASLPRSAALETEILRQTDADAPAFQVVEVTRTALPALSQWPQTRLTRGEGWINTHRGIASSVIKAGDRLTLTIWDSQANSLLTSEGQKSVAMSNLRVAPNGTIFIPYTGTIDVGGLTPTSCSPPGLAWTMPSTPSASAGMPGGSHRRRTATIGASDRPFER